jgi:hypothetical protein
MQLHEPTPDRKPVHKREVTIDVFLCPDRAWEVDAMIADVPQRSVDMVCGLKQAGDDLHRMQLRLRVARDSNTVLEASAQTIAAPYREHCANHGSIYQALVGLNAALPGAPISRSWRRCCRLHWCRQLPRKRPATGKRVAFLHSGHSSWIAAMHCAATMKPSGCSIRNGIVLPRTLGRTDPPLHRASP